MKRTLMYLVLAVGSMASTAFAQTVANGPYYATPSWDQTLPSSTRFIVLSNMASAAVLDRETGLVWERSPESTFTFTWANTDAARHCNNSAVGNRKGWRLPTSQELASLVDPTVASPGPTLPAGHPFLNVQTSFPYWSATTVAARTNDAWVVSFFSGNVVFEDVAKSLRLLVWCVRGGQGVDPQ